MGSRHISPLVRLVHLRWAIPVLALLVEGTTGVPGSRGGGAKFVTLVRRAGVGPESLRRTLDALVEAGWVRRNPGYGHPMRPEYVLSPRGVRLARAAERVMGVLERLGVAETGLRKWSLPVTLALGSTPARFGELQAALSGITPRALALALKELEASGLVEREVGDAYPPRPRYGLSRRGRTLRREAQRLERALRT
jgi:DNA-binding HxlR family transcriptional regulator